MKDEERDETIKPSPSLAGPANLPGNQMRGKASGPVRLASPPKCPTCGTDTELDPADPDKRRGLPCETCAERTAGRAPPPMWNLGQPKQTGVNLGDIRD